MTSVDCPRCGAPSSGHFCSNCGSSLAARACPSCAAVLPRGARFCTQCGTSLTGDAPGGMRSGEPVGVAAERSPAWYIAGVTTFALLVMIGWQVWRANQPEAPVAGLPAAAGTPPDISGMPPIQAADQLFNRIMTAVESGDEATVQGFMPMAIAAYERARPLNADGFFHLNMLHRTAGDFPAAQAIAEEGLATDPDHLLLLAGAGEAAEAAGDLDTARRYWQHFLDAYDAQRARPLEEYMIHEGILEQSRTHAREVVGG
jgi:tetratricopeptide (TPR) repeat protein